MKTMVKLLNYKCIHVYIQHYLKPTVLSKCILYFSNIYINLNIIVENI